MYVNHNPPREVALRIETENAISCSETEVLLTPEEAARVISALSIEIDVALEDPDPNA
ncbi:hypothetical protein [Corynebacterium phocae]|uniref:hypothetical protein n=1 Tax=Corynebacterium phocae TaxID=161895 RepID=UPI0012ED6634|nr:hypothetical protein [Corynebacterium phocae]